MRTRDEFLQAFKDEMIGLVLAGFEDFAASKGDFSTKGRAFTGAQHRAYAMLDRMYDFMQPTVLPVKPVNGVPGPMGVKR